MTTAQDIDRFFEKQRHEIAEKQSNLSTKALDNLFYKSPHHDPMRLDPRFSDSEYDANHKISINNSPVSSHNGPTFSVGISKV